MIEVNDIISTLSGGLNNQKSEKSLGGEASSHFVSKRIFNNIESADAILGNTDYRCIYLKNNNASDILGSVVAYLEKDTTIGTNVQIGFKIETCVQQVTIKAGTLVSSGNNTFSLNGDQFIVTHNASLDAWTENFQTAIRDLNYLDDVIVSYTTADTDVIFQILFTGKVANHYFPVIELVGNTLNTSPIILINKIIDGGPINSTTVEIDHVRTPPTNVTFYDGTVTIGNLFPLETFPVWFKRICSANTQFITDDGFILKLDGNICGIL